MQLAETQYDNSETGCCARLDVDHWDRREIEWERKPFVRDQVRKLFHIPVNYGSVIGRVNDLIESAEAYTEEPLWLTDEVSSWVSILYTASNGDVPGATMEYLSGTFLTRVFEGPYRKVREWADETSAYARERGANVTRFLFYYATCPRCAKKFGENLVVVFAQVA